MGQAKRNKNSKRFRFIHLLTTISSRYNQKEVARFLEIRQTEKKERKNERTNCIN